MMKLLLWGCLFGATLAVASARGHAQESPTASEKSGSAFYPASILERARANAAALEWAANMRDGVVAAAEPWLNAPDEELWSFMFSPTIRRSWMVWSDGFCPACKEDVRMYAWEMNFWEWPWKVRCPRCKELFPKNDFKAYYESGLDEHGVFQPDRADRTFLYNVEHPDQNDPLHLFGVDDGEGYVDPEGRRWRFIGAYLIYGQWKQGIVDGIRRLGAAHAVTGDPRYAFKAALMLDRVADLFPSFDFGEQAVLYERKADRGQVSTWHDACEEVRELALAYDRIFESARDQGDALAAFLAPRAAQLGLTNPKTSWAEVQRNIEDRVFHDTLAHRERIESNRPRTDVAVLVLTTVLGWPGNREQVLSMLDDIITRTTAVDGVSGEKGLTGYSTIAPRALGEILSQFSLLEPGFLQTVFERHPVLHRTLRFHIDTWCMMEWAPRIGDCGTFGMKTPDYCGLSFTTNPGVDPSMWTFLWDVYGLTRDPDFARVLFHANGQKTDGLPYDLFAENPAVVQEGVQEIINDSGPIIAPESIDLPQWRLAIQRSGGDGHRRAVWLDYDASGGHGHADGLNLGLFAKGLDLLPDFGYPPVGYGGWDAPRARWYTMTAAHNTVVVDGMDQQRVDGRMTLWADGERTRIMRAAAPEMYGIEQYDRVVAMVDLNEDDVYIVDCFFVRGGKDHAKMLHSYFGGVESAGLDLADAEPFLGDVQMRGFRRDAAPQPGWSVDWTLANYHGYLAEGREVHLRYTDLTEGAEAWLADDWVDAAGFAGKEEWIACAITRRTAEASPLASAFVGVIEPYDGARALAGIRRLPLSAGDGVALEITRADGLTDVFIVSATPGAQRLVEPAHGVVLEGETALVTFSGDAPWYLAVGGSGRVQTGGDEAVVPEGQTHAEHWTVQYTNRPR